MAIMKTTDLKLMAASLGTLMALAPGTFAQLAIPSDGSDGALNITSNTVIDLSLAVSGVWSNNNSANIGKGIYDSSKWAVVFKYASVTIASNASVTFKNHSTRAPVVWLVMNDVTINGSVSLNGQDWLYDPVRTTEPGPGGFRGGSQIGSNLGNGTGFGPGGYVNDHGSYSTYHAYGNPQIMPLIGGSGGSAGDFAQYCTPGNGAAGGGAILIAAAGTILINGSVTANGGGGYSGGCGFLADYGSGGGIRLVANQVLGAGTVAALGIYPGRVRVEANAASTILNVNPTTLAVSPAPLVIWPATNAPTLRVVSVGGQTAPLDPKAGISLAEADLTLTATNAVMVVLQTTHFPTNGTVNVFVKPRNSAQSILQATYQSGDIDSALWQLTTTLPLSHCVIQARATSN